MLVELRFLTLTSLVLIDGLVLNCLASSMSCGLKILIGTPWFVLVERLWPKWSCLGCEDMSNYYFYRIKLTKVENSSLIIASSLEMQKERRGGIQTKIYLRRRHVQEECTERSVPASDWMLKNKQQSRPAYLICKL